MGAARSCTRSEENRFEVLKLHGFAITKRGQLHFVCCTKGSTVSHVRLFCARAIVTGWQMMEQTRQAAARGDADVTALADLEFVPYIDDAGMIPKLETSGVKASVYAVYDEVRSDSRAKRCGYLACTAVLAVALRAPHA